MRPYRLRFLFYLVLILCFQACKIPSYTVILTNDPTLGSDKHLTTIPNDWNGRLMRFSDGSAGTQIVTTGGDPVHHHDILQTHEVQSSPTTQVINPFGEHNVAASANHLHKVKSISQNPEVSSDEVYDPYHQELLAYVVAKNMSTIPVGLIVPYIGDDLPQGWDLCDGRNGTPNLEGVYIELKKSGPLSGPSGINQHQHNIKHDHAWSVEAPDLNRPLGKAVAGDEIAHQEDNVAINSFMHNHNVISVWQGSELTEPAAVFPPSVKVRFIRSTTNAKRIPRGVILPNLAASAPMGWKELPLSQETKGRFLFASAQATGLKDTFGSLTHSHSYVDSHLLTLTPRPTTTVISGVFTENNLPVSLLGHQHTATVNTTEQTGLSNALPKWVAFSFIIKN